MKITYTLEEHKLMTSAALESLIDACQREIKNIKRFGDERMLVATADIKRHYEWAIEEADKLEDEFRREREST